MQGVQPDDLIVDVKRRKDPFNVPSGSNIKIRKKQIKRVKFVKFLGILLDEHLSWKYHLNELAKKIIQNMWSVFQN